MNIVALEIPFRNIYSELRISLPHNAKLSDGRHGGELYA
jgi:hypothetical protein